MVQDEERKGRSREENGDFIDYVINKNMESVIQFSQQIDKTVLFSAVKLIMEAESVYIVAIGNTIPVAEDLGFRLERFGIKAYTANRSETYLNYISLGSDRDILIAISQSGVSKLVIQAAEMAQEIGMKIIGITGKQISPLAQIAGYTLLVGDGNGLFTWGNEPVSHVCEMIINDLILYTIKCFIKKSSGTKGRKTFIDEVSEITSSEKMELLKK